MINRGRRTSVKKDMEGGTKRDICQTPYYAIEPLLEFIPKSFTIWDSCVGPKRNLQRYLEHHGYKVHGTDILYGENYFTYTPDFTWDMQVCNVPFSLKIEWVDRAKELGKPFAFLVPTATLFNKNFQERKDDKTFIIAPDRRINFDMPEQGYASSADFHSSWWVWGLPVPETQLTVVYKTMGREKDLPEIGLKS